MNLFLSHDIVYNIIFSIKKIQTKNHCWYIFDYWENNLALYTKHILSYKDMT